MTAGVFEKKNVKNGQKALFGILKKIKTLVLSGIGLKWKLLWSFNMLQKLHAWEKSGSQFPSYGQKWFSANDISVFFNRQYFINRLINDFGM